MKTGSDNFRASAVQGIISRLKERQLNVVIYEPVLEEENFLGCEVIRDLSVFKSKADLIVSNRLTEELFDVADRVYTRDLFNAD